MLKRTLSAFLVVVLLLSLIPGIAFADGELTLTVSSTSGEPGDTVDIAVSINNTLPICVGAMEITYNKTELELVDVKLTDELNEAGIEIYIDESSVLADGEFYFCAKDESWSAFEISGDFLILTFFINAGAPSLEFDIGISYCKTDVLIDTWGPDIFWEDLYFWDGDGIPYENTLVTTGTITVTGGASEHSISKANGIVNGDFVIDPENETAGKTITVTVIPAEDYRLKAGSLTANGEEITEQGDEPNTYTFTMPDEDVVVSAEFEPLPEHAITMSVTGSGGDITIFPESAKAGAEITVTVAAEDGNRLVADSLKVNGDAALLTQNSVNKAEYTFVMPDEAVEVSAAFEEIPSFNIEKNVTTAGAGTGDVDVPATAVEGTTVTITVKPGTDSLLIEKELTVVGKTSTSKVPTTSAAANTFTFTMPAEAVTVNATFGDTSLKSHLWGGEGTESEPYTISNVEGFLDFRDRVNKDEKYENAFFLLTADLDITKHEANFEPIKNFQGTFDGNGKTINVEIDTIFATIAAVSDNVGLFRTVNVVKNLELEGSVQGLNYVAGIAANAKYIENCNNYAKVSSYGNFAAGIAYEVDTVIRCANYGSLNGRRGGAAGIAIRVRVLAEECINYAFATGPGVIVAGIAIGVPETATVINCGNVGGLDAGKPSANSVAAGTSAAGIAIEVSGTIVGCWNTGNVTGGGKYVSGIVSNVPIGATIKDCYNMGTVTGGENTAGILSYGVASANINIENCYNTGKISNNSTNPSAILGNSDVAKTTLTNNYYLEGTATQGSGVSTDENGKVEPKTDTEMKATAFVTLLNAGRTGDEAPFGTPASGGHPILKWQGSIVDTTIKAEKDKSGDATSATISGTELRAHIDEEGHISVNINTESALAGDNIKSTTITIETATIAALKDANASIAITTDIGIVAFDAKTIAEIAAKAGTDNVVLEIKSVNKSAMPSNSAANEILNAAETTFFIITLKANGTDIFPSTNGATNEIKVSVPGTRPTDDDGKNKPGRFEAYFIPTIGAPEKLVAGDANGYITFTTKHFSAYAVQFIERITTDGGAPGTEDNPNGSGNATAPVWDGQTLDIRWYSTNPNASTFTIRYPAEFAGLAALVNGLYNEQIDTIFGDPNGEYIKATSAFGGDSGSQNLSTDTYYFGTETFANKTIILGADINMGSSNNYMPVGGQYLMILGDSTTKIGSSFNGTLDGNGHTVTIYTDRWASAYGDGQSVGLIGRLGVHDNDTVPNATPTVKNVIVRGSIRANRSVGGIVGKIGKTHAGGFIENCANYASISNTDSKGIGGIVGAGWNGGHVINCYNAGDITSSYAAPAGGIVGYNEIHVENCYNYGTIRAASNSFAMAIGTDNGGAPVVFNSYYLVGSAPGGGYYGGGKNTDNGAVELTATYMKSDDFVDDLGDGFKKDTSSQNQGYPVLTFGNAKPSDGSNTDNSGGGTTVGEGENLAENRDQLEIIEPTASNDNGTSTAKVTADEIKEAVENADDGNKPGIAIIPKNVGDGVKKVVVELPTSSAKTIADKDLSLVISTPLGDLTFDDTALAAIHKGATGDTIQIIVETVSDSKLSNAQKDAIGDRPAVELTVMSNGKAISSFGTGRVIVSIPYELKSGELPEGLRLYHVAADGKRTEIPCTYNRTTKCIVFAVTHFSVYVIDYDASVVWNNPFTDVNESNWFYDAVKFVSSRGLMNGTGESTFAPNANLTRAMLVTVLYRYEGEPRVSGNGGFTDVPSGQWYTDAIAWAAANGIVNGVGDDKFDPNGNITREQLATILHRYTSLKGGDVTTTTDLVKFEDAFDISSWASDAMKWANAEGLITGRTATTLAPKGTATRAEVATILMRYIGE